MANSLVEKQKVKEMYGLREKQFKRFFSIAIKSREGVPGENLIELLERRLDNIIYRIKVGNNPNPSASNDYSWTCYGQW